MGAGQGKAIDVKGRGGNWPQWGLVFKAREEPLVSQNSTFSSWELSLAWERHGETRPLTP